MARKPIYAWDANCFIDWLGDNKAGAQIDGIAAVIEEIEQGVATLITSVMAYTEVLDSHHTLDQRKQFKGFLNRSNVEVFETNIPIAEKVQQLRSECQMDTPPKSIKALDATFLAVAVLFKATALHTTDHGLLRLSGNKIVNGLTICHPSPAGGQKVFGFKG